MELDLPSAPDLCARAALAAAEAGTWRYDVATDRLHYDAAMAALYCIPAEEGAAGLPYRLATTAIHPADLAIGLVKRAQLIRYGGPFALEYRVGPSPDRFRQVLLRGRFEAGPNGLIAGGRGIAVDMTAAGERVVPPRDEQTGSTAETLHAMDQITRHIIAARRMVDRLQAGAARHLRPAADAFLLTIARQLVDGLVSAGEDGTRH